MTLTPESRAIWAAFKRAVEAEREAIAKMADVRAQELYHLVLDSGPELYLEEFAAAIRARG